VGAEVFDLCFLWIPDPSCNILLHGTYILPGSQKTAAKIQQLLNLSYQQKIATKKINASQQPRGFFHFPKLFYNSREYENDVRI